jgi:hypothetical protein
MSDSGLLACGETLSASMAVSSDFTAWETSPDEFHHGETNPFFLLVVSCKKSRFADVALKRTGENPVETGLRTMGKTANKKRPTGQP